jgi:hypothetical protein
MPLYLIGDGDNIRNRIEFYLLNGHLKKLTHFSESLTEAIGILRASAISEMGAEIVYAGGDDIFFHVDKNRYERPILEEMSNTFFRITGSTISFGVGESIEAAFLNLTRAKASGKGQIVDSH